MPIGLKQHRRIGRSNINAPIVAIKAKLILHNRLGQIACRVERQGEHRG